MSTMIGYINAPSSFTIDGWLMTGDIVEYESEFIIIILLLFPFLGFIEIISIHPFSQNHY
ncbi:MULTISPECIES: hypothetical protein [Bacillus]|uniref:hypothetical protein n=2 Tax=Bacillus TaxID=1386 RepID=UPI001F5BE970|nr:MULTISPECIES: hypothetical protein [Bacillus]